MRRAALLACALAGCAEPPQPTTPAAGQSHPTVAMTGMPQMPLLVRYKPTGQGGPEVFRQAIVAGKLDLSGACARLVSPGRAAVIVTSAGTRLQRDSAGPYLPSQSDRLRHGDEIVGGGGEIGGEPLARSIDGTIPEKCRGGQFTEMVGIRRFRPTGDPPPVPPPPPDDP